MDKDIVYVVEDDMDLAEILTFNLENEGFEVKHFTNGNEFFKTMEQTIPNIIILDIMLPGYDGVRIAKILRQNILYKDIPIIFLLQNQKKKTR